MVPQIIAVQISGVLEYLRDARFIIDPTEDQAGMAMLQLLRQADSSEGLEFKAFHVAISSLKIMSPKALLIERRSIRKLLDKIHGSDPKKEKILNYFLYLIKKYGRGVKADTVEHKNDHSPHDISLNSIPVSVPNASALENSDEPTTLGETRIDSIVNNVPPEEFCCPISSRLMYDPVVISSGQTFERICIEKWFSEGHGTCPKTHEKLSNLYMIPNSCMKDLISNWCRKHGVNLEDPLTRIQYWETSHCNSISSLKNVSAALLYGSNGDYLLQSDNSNLSFISSDTSYCSDSSQLKSMDSLTDNHLQLFTWSDDYLKCQSFSNFSLHMYLRFFARLCELKPDHRDKAVEDLKMLLESDEELFYAMISNGFVEALTIFLKNAYNMSDMLAQRTGAQIFLAFLSNNRVEIPSLDEDAFELLTSFLESEITLEALMILQKVCRHPNYKSSITFSTLSTSIIKILDCKNHKLLEPAIKILFDLSSYRELRYHIISSGCIQKLVPLMNNGRFAELCIKILHNLSDIKEAIVLISETNGCITSIAELLETGSQEEQDHGVAILHSLCSQNLECCLQVMKEGVIPSLVDISVNGNLRGKENSMKLLHLLKDFRLSGSFENSDPQSVSAPELAVEDRKQPDSKSSHFFGRKMRFFFKPR